MSDRGRRTALVGLRLATGVIGLGVSVLVIAAVALIPFPTLSAPVSATRVVPEPAPTTQLCPGALLRLGDQAGTDAAAAASVGRASVVDDAGGASVQRATLTPSASDATVLTAPAGTGSRLSGAQSQTVSTDELRGLAAAACREPSASAWLVGGSTATGRTTLVTLSNPTPIDATVRLRLWGESGPVDAPGLSGIVVSAGAQRVVSLAGIAPDTGSPVVEVETSGSQVVATLQSSVVRTLDPGGVDTTGDADPPTRDPVIPGVRIVSPDDVSALQGDADYRDARPVVRLLSPSAAARVHLTVRRAGDGAERESTVPLTAGTVLDVPLDTLPEGIWSVFVDSDAPVVAAMRAGSAAPLTGEDLESPVSDIAWFASAPALGDTADLAVPDGPDPRLVLANPGSSARSVRLSADGGADSTLRVPAHDSVAVPVESQSAYRLRGASGLRAAVTLADAGRIASFTVASPRAGSQPIVVRP